MSRTLDDLTASVAEVSDGYAKNCGINRDTDWYVLKLQEEVGELVSEHLRLSGRGRLHGKSRDEMREALEDETADVLAHILLFAKANEIDLEQALERKWLRYLEHKPE